MRVHSDNLKPVEGGNVVLAAFFAVCEAKPCHLIRQCENCGNNFKFLSKYSTRQWAKKCPRCWKAS